MLVLYCMCIFCIFATILFDNECPYSKIHSSISFLHFPNLFKLYDLNDKTIRAFWYRCNKCDVTEEARTKEKNDDVTETPSSRDRGQEGDVTSQLAHARTHARTPL